MGKNALFNKGQMDYLTITTMEVYSQMVRRFQRSLPDQNDTQLRNNFVRPTDRHSLVTILARLVWAAVATAWVNA